jgi:hypothetical protein
MLSSAFRLEDDKLDKPPDQSTPIAARQLRPDQHRTTRACVAG